ncbi:AlpA family phage regulatory protein [Ancylobacter sp. SL191]|nr:AlpA family phage regulatory protein [Ancylobacter sp. SL191]WAC27025.1 AlpA family phage regulatory protein [Ancylobacter sp. SL191]
MSRSTFYRKIAEGTFPAQLRISTNGEGWHESDTNAWLPIRRGGGYRRQGDLRQNPLIKARSIPEAGQSGKIGLGPTIDVDVEDHQDLGCHR